MIDFLSKLDNDQLNAVKCLDNALVIAGAGSGKTTTIIAKINYLLMHNYYKADEILVISFTNESVNTLKKRLSYPLSIKTFHKLAVDIIDDYNLRISPDHYLDYIINEYFNAYALTNLKSRRRIKRILLNQQLNSLQSLIKTFINLYKSNYENINFIFYLYRHAYFLNKDYLYIILEIYQMYLRELEASGFLDFDDLITYANKLITLNKRTIKYKLVIIDEFQDTSLVRFNLIQSILKQNNGKLFAVGDDYQSIYRFSGCDLEIFINLNKFVHNVKRINLNHNYRNPQNLINVANQFILKNPRQIPKQTICHKNVNKPVVIHFYHDQKTIINQVINELTGEILVLGRNNRDQERFMIKENKHLRFLTIHRAKGLEAENIILVNFENARLGFPSQIPNERLLAKVLKKDYLLFEEERRLMYVALTRTKNKVFLLVPINNYSVFIKELIKDYYQFIDIKKQPI